MIKIGAVPGGWTLLKEADSPGRRARRMQMYETGPHPSKFSERPKDPL